MLSLYSHSLSLLLISLSLWFVSHVRRVLPLVDIDYFPITHLTPPLLITSLQTKYMNISLRAYNNNDNKNNNKEKKQRTWSLFSHPSTAEHQGRKAESKNVLWGQQNCLFFPVIWLWWDVGGGSITSKTINSAASENKLGDAAWDHFPGTTQFQSRKKKKLTNKQTKGRVIIRSGGQGSMRLRCQCSAVVSGTG